MTPCVLVPHLTELFGDKPRMKLLEALIELAPYAFTLPELAEQARLDKNVYREIDSLVEEGMVKQVSKTRPAKFRVNQKLLSFQLVDFFAVVAEAVDKSVRPKAEAARVINQIWDALRTATRPGIEVIQATNTGSIDRREETYVVLNSDGQQTIAAPREGESHVLPVGNL